ncbi:MAG TPA: hypothetical protein VHK27_00420 [Gammaproteobacteria bacterium]|nr:hypothetical protein [Gammaproteobacteria bacterium]
MFDTCAAAAHSQSTGSSAPFIEDFTSHIYKLASQTPTDQHSKYLQIPAGFQIQRFASGLGEPRMLTVADDEAVYVTRPSPGDVMMLRDVNGDGKADEKN